MKSHLLSIDKDRGLVVDGPKVEKHMLALPRTGDTEVGR